MQTSVTFTQLTAFVVVLISLLGIALIARRRFAFAEERVVAKL